jgi:hypothetical protein
MNIILSIDENFILKIRAFVKKMKKILGKLLFIEKIEMKKKLK